MTVTITPKRDGHGWSVYPKDDYRQEACLGSFPTLEHAVSFLDNEWPDTTWDVRTSRGENPR